MLSIQTGGNFLTIRVTIDLQATISNISILKASKILLIFITPSSQKQSRVIITVSRLTPNPKEDPPYGESFFLVEYVQSNWNLIAAELLRWNRSIAQNCTIWSES